MRGEIKFVHSWVSWLEVLALLLFPLVYVYGGPSAFLENSVLFCFWALAIEHMYCQGTGKKLCVCFVPFFRSVVLLVRY